MPELPDITVYCEALEARILGERLLALELRSPFLLRTVTPPAAAFAGRKVVALRRLGKRIAIGCEDEHWLVLHLMIAGRLAWANAPRGGRSRNVLAAIHFSSGVLTLTEAGSKRRAALHLVEGEAALAALDPGGIEIQQAGLAEFTARLCGHNHTLKRALTDPGLFSGIGNAYSDEILHAARLPPLALTQHLDEDAVARLYRACRQVLDDWTSRLRAATGADFPTHVTAFRDGMAVHGRYGQPCPACGAPVQRIRYAERELDYCARCQNGGRRYADRALSRLLHEAWPRTLDE